MVRNSTERLGGEYDLEPRESALSLYTVSVSHTALPSICKCGLTLVLNGAVMFHDPLYC